MSFLKNKHGEHLFLKKNNKTHLNAKDKVNGLIFGAFMTFVKNSKIKQS